MRQPREPEGTDQVYRQIVGPLPSWWVEIPETSWLEQPSPLQVVPSELRAGTTAPELHAERRA